MAKTIAASGKMVLLDKLLPKLQADGHRVLIFSFFDIEDFLFRFELQTAMPGK